MQTEIYEEKAVLVGLITPQQKEERAKEYLDELAFLADTAGASPEKLFFQRIDYPNPKTFVGPGKLAEIKTFIEENEIGLVIFDDELSPKQLKNIEAELKVKILDRTNLILDIFAKRAQTANAKTQVELAQYQYMFPAWMKYVMQHDINRFAQFAVRVWGCEMDFGHPEITARQGIERYEQFLVSIGMDFTLEYSSLRWA